MKQLLNFIFKSPENWKGKFIRQND